MCGAMTAATCVPSRAMLHTGKHTFHLREHGSRFDPNDTTIGETLRKNGYYSFFTGKRHSLDREMLKRSFDDGGVVMGYAGYLLDKRRMPMHQWDPEAVYDYDTGFIVSGEPGHPRVSVPHIKEKEQETAGPYSTEIYVDEAVDFIINYNGNKPWFSYVALSSPHDPHEAPESIRKLYNPETIPLPPNFLAQHPFDNGDLGARDEILAALPREPNEIKQRIADYYAATTYLDLHFGRIIDALESTKQLDNTIIIFAGDSGLAVGQHGLLGKQNLYDDAGVHVPCVMAGPGIPKGKRIDALLPTYDIFPTICEMTGIAIPETIDGISAVPLFKGQKELHKSLYMPYMEFQRAVVEKRYKLIEYVNADIDFDRRQGNYGTRYTQLFDLLKDPWETTNLADKPKHAATLKRMRKRMLELRDEFDDGTERGKKIAPEMHERYVEFWEKYK